MNITRACVLSTIVLLVCSASTLRAEVMSDSFARDVSGAVVPFLIAGELSLFSDKQEFTTGIKVLGATCISTSILKRLVGEKRPNTDSTFSFPSGHTTAAFAMATVLTEYKPQYRWPAYATAAAIGYSRVEIGSHHWQDVVGGAAIGYYIAKRFTNKQVAVTPNGFALQWSL